MSYEIKIHTVPARHLAVIQQRRNWSEPGGQLIPLLDRVYAKVRAGVVIQSSPNVFVYRDGAKDGVTVEIGVEIAARFEDVVPPSSGRITMISFAKHSSTDP